MIADNVVIVPKRTKLVFPNLLLSVSKTVRAARPMAYSFVKASAGSVVVRPQSTETPSVPTKAMSIRTWSRTARVKGPTMVWLNRRHSPPVRIILGPPLLRTCATRKELVTTVMLACVASNRAKAKTVLPPSR